MRTENLILDWSTLFSKNGKFQPFARQMILDARVQGTPEMYREVPTAPGSMLGWHQEDKIVAYRKSEVDIRSRFRDYTSALNGQLSNHLFTCIVLPKNP